VTQTSSPRIFPDKSGAIRSPRYNCGVTFDRRTVEAQLSLGLIASRDMPKIAWDALEAGMDGPAIRRLAALDSPTYFEVRDILSRAMEEMGLTNISRNVAALRLAKNLANDILASGSDPLKYQREFFLLWIRSGYPRELQSVGNLRDEIHVACTLGRLSEDQDKIRDWVNARLREFVRVEESK
jgi:hypothetical protein